MTDGPVSPPPGGNKSIVERVKDLLTSPKTEWAVIDREPGTIASIFTSYVMILAAIPPIASAIGLFLFVPRGVVVYGVVIGISMTSIIVGLIVQYALGLLSVYLLSLIIDALAPSFGSSKDPVKAFKVAAYYPTPFWVACILMIFPPIGVLGMLIGGIYGLYLLYLGLPMLMKTPPDKAVGYFGVTLIVAIVVIGIVNSIGQRVIYGGYF